MTSLLTGSRTRMSEARRGSGTRPVSFSNATRACGPEIRITAIAAGGRPDERAKMVSRSVPIAFQVCVQVCDRCAHDPNKLGYM